MKKLFLSIAERLNVSPDQIGRDGVKFRGSGPYFSRYGYWERESGPELEIWNKSRSRILEINKDLNDSEAWDIRAETGLKNHFSIPTIGCRFYRNLMRWEFLCREFIEDRSLPGFDSLSDEVLIESFNSSTSARINCKKTVGNGSCSNRLLMKYINLYGDIVSKNVKELNPHLVLIGGCSGNIILNGIVKRSYPDLIPFGTDGWIYYSQESNVIVINGYHPNPRCKNDAEIYNQMKEALSKFQQSEQYRRFQNLKHES